MELYNVIKYCNIRNLEAFVMTVDFEKAFDRMEWEPLYTVLTVYNFGPVIISMIKLVYKNITGEVQNNGHLSNFFSLSDGARQGC